MPDVGIELGAACMPSELPSDRATAPGLSLMGETEKIFQQPNQPPTVGLLDEFVGHQARRSRSQDEESDLTVFLVNARRIDVRRLRFGPQGIKRFAGDLSVQSASRKV